MRSPWWMLATLALTGCGTDVELHPRTSGSKPAGDGLTLTLGVATVVAATDGGDDTLDPDCRATLTSEDEAIVGVLETETVNEFALVGQSEGTTQIFVDLDGEPNATIPVTVVDR